MAQNKTIPPGSGDRPDGSLCRSPGLRSRPNTPCNRIQLGFLRIPDCDPTPTHSGGPQPHRSICENGSHSPGTPEFQSPSTRKNFYGEHSCWSLEKAEACICRTFFMGWRDTTTATTRHQHAPSSEQLNAGWGQICRNLRRGAQVTAIHPCSPPA